MISSVPRKHKQIIIIITIILFINKLDVENVTWITHFTIKKNYEYLSLNAETKVLIDT